MAKAKVTRERLVREWCKELENGKHEQGREVLRGKDGSECCLGVAYAAGKRLGLCRSARAPLHRGFPGRWFKNIMDTDNPRLTREVDCTCANDSRRWSFAKIAAALRREYLKKKAAKP